MPDSTPAPALHRDTLAIITGRPVHEPDAAMNVPPHLSSTYVAGGTMGYARYGNPSWIAFESALGTLEGGHCISFASGVAALAAVFDLVPQGGVVVAPHHSYTGTVAQLDDREALGRLRTRYVDISDTDAVIAACAGAALLVIESPTNPALETAEFAPLIAAAHAAGALVLADNTFATPLRQRPLEYGADFVAHSATKYISGHSDVLMGAVITATEEHRDAITSNRGLYGAIPGPFESFLALRGLRTLPVRFERAEASAREIVRRLDGHAALEEVRYPGFGAIVSIVVAGGPEAADAFVGRSTLWVNATSLGGVESTFERRRRWPAEPKTISDGLVRLSVGLEHVDDLVNDLLDALG